MEAAVSQIDEALRSLAAQGVSLPQEDVEKLRHDLLVILPVVRSLEEEVFTSEAVQSWLQSLKDFAYDAADALDELKTEFALQRRQKLDEGAGDAARPTSRLVSSCLPPCFTFTRHRVVSVLKDLNQKLDKIMNRQQLLVLQPTGGNSRPGTSVTKETCDVLDTRFPLIGRDEHKQLLIKSVCDVHESLGSERPVESSNGGADVLQPEPCSSRGGEKHIHVVPIVGMGGVGKTTLAQSVFNDEQVQNKFPMRKWLFVGEVFDGLRLLREITDQYDEKLSMNTLSHRLRSMVGDENFLIVLDDVWSDRSMEWEALLTPLRHAGKGHKAVLVTTRNQAVAGTMGPVPFTYLPPLTYQESLSIFERCAFGDKNPEERPELKRIGEKIVQKLGGNPLAAKALGASLCRRLREDWEKVLNSGIWLKRLSESDILPILRLSYQNLPSELKQCFTYCSIFPKDHRFDRGTLIWMWMAHGYIVPEGGVRMEDTGSDYFDELLDRTFFQDIGGHFVMHDLMHDLAESLSVEECVRIEEMNAQQRATESVRHLSVCSRSTVPSVLHAYKKTRTLLCFRGLSVPPEADVVSGGGAALRMLFNNLKCTRVLDLRGSCIPQSLPECIGVLKHIRYLDLTHTRVAQLPKSLCRLYNLQTLRVYKDCILPRDDMWKLVNLRHLEAGKFQISTIPWLGKLTCLQELPAFRVNQVLEGHTMDELRGMTQLRGRLCIDYMKDVGTAEDAARAQLKDKKLLRGLELDWRRGSTREMTPLEEDEVMEVLQPHPGLEELRLLDFGGTKPPSWLTELSVPNLVSVELIDCRRWKALPPLGQLRSLRSLRIGGMAEVEEVGAEFFFGHGDSSAPAFSSLAELSFQYMERWSSWDCPDGGGECCFPRLRRLEISDCPLLASVSAPLRQRVEAALATNQGTLFCQGCPELLKTWSSIPPPEELTARDGRLLSWALQECGGKLQTLKILKLQGCSDLTTFTDAEVREEYWQQSLPSLRELHLECPNLRSFLVGRLPSLQQLHIHKCSQIHALPSGLHGIPCLQVLRVAECPSIHSLEKLQRLPCLRELYIVGCSAVEKLPELEGLISLQKLHIIRCPVVQSLPCLQGLHALQDLHIAECPGIQALPELRGLNSLQELYVAECTNIQGLPELQSLHSLRHLYVIKCPRVRALPELHGLRALQVLHVIKCPDIRALPEGSLPSTVWTLVIRGCPQLQRRCRATKEKRTDWPKIAHIPNIQIDWETVRGLSNV